MQKEIFLKQIILVTDGESNSFKNPINITKKVIKEGITVSTIGILNEKSNTRAKFELESIADIGKGVCELTNIENLSSTVYNTTKKSIYNTLQSVINTELKKVVGSDISNVDPTCRQKVIMMMEDLSDSFDLKTIILLDTSKSMNLKVNAAKKSIINLLNTLKSRKGKNHIAVMIFPYKDKDYKLICDFTDNIRTLKKSLKSIVTQGLTPTGEALENAYIHMKRD
ncbi:vWA domain-containing protein [Senegalia massiliensis]|uniref:VWA domain-containing protein n=1 Tax=Senegalia massiliensis TaxID=1720316 RepID=A0A845R0H1_9CLOT|nr:VWA domain-containing protein [Senegalia massiliensis]NBI07499.1 VWA domain-containing protein [Senegalia massiliensis]